MKHTFGSRLRLSHLAFPAGLSVGYVSALFDRSHDFKFLSTLFLSGSMLQLFAVIVILVIANWTLKDFAEHFKQFFSVYSLKLDSIKALGEQRMTEVASSKQSIEVTLQKLEKIPVQQGIQDIHEKIDQLINVLNRNANRPHNEQRPGNPKPEMSSPGPQPQHGKSKHRKHKDKPPGTSKPEIQTGQKPSQTSESGPKPDPENWATQVI